MTSKFIALTMASLMLIAGCASNNATRPPLADSQQGVFIHEPSHFSFPAVIGRFERDAGIQFYDKTGRDVSVPYLLRLQGAEVDATVYIYPALQADSITPPSGFGQTPEACFTQQYDEVKTVIVTLNRARLLSESDFGINRSGMGPAGRKAIFEWNGDGETTLSHLYLFAHRGWFVKYRFTYPGRYSARIEPEIDRFVSAFEWP